MEDSRQLRLISAKITILIEHICTRIVPELFSQYEARKGDPEPCPEGEIKVTDDVSDYP
jgi:hypothetical protein